MLWCKENGLSPNLTKTKSLIVGSSGKLKKLRNPRKLSFERIDIDFVKKYEYLGTILDSDMSLLPLFKNVIKNDSNKIFILRKIRKYVDSHTAICICK